MSIESEIPNLLTPCSSGEMMAALRLAWTETMGYEPAQGPLCVLLAHWALETGRGKSCHCWNIGNYKHVPGDGRDYTYYPCSEVLHGKVVHFDPSNAADRPTCCFRAYQIAAAGCLDYLWSLRTRFSSAWPEVIRADPKAFSHALKIAHYYTANEAQYTAAMASLFCEFMKLPMADHPILTDDERKNFMTLVESNLDRLQADLWRSEYDHE